MTNKEADDAISRQAVNEIINDIRDCISVEGYCAILERLKKLSPVNPQPKTGHWIHGEYCSECGCDVPAYIIDWKWQKDMDAKYCPNCGCRIVEPQESEDE